MVVKRKIVQLDLGSGDDEPADKRSRNGSSGLA
jgi:hypothetical protein